MVQGKYPPPILHKRILGLSKIKLLTCIQRVCNACPNFPNLYTLKEIKHIVCSSPTNSFSGVWYVTEFMKTWLLWVSTGRIPTGPMLTVSLVSRLWLDPPHPGQWVTVHASHWALQLSWQSFSAEAWFSWLGQIMKKVVASQNLYRTLMKGLCENSPLLPH